MASDQQLEFLKSKVLELAGKHRVVVTKLKSEIRSAMEMASREKAISIELERKLDEEKRRYYVLEAQKSSSPSTDTQKEIMELKSALNAEIQKSTVLANQLKDAALDSSSIESLKDAAYQKASITRLEADLKSEIERSARIKNEISEKVDAVEDKYKKELKEINAKKFEVEEELKKLQGQIETLKSTSQESNESLQTKIDELTKESEELNEKFKTKTEEIEARDKDIEEKKVKLKEMKENLKEEIKNHEDDNNNLHLLLNEQEHEVSRLAKITDRFDVVLMDRKMRCLKEDVHIIIKSPKQIQLREKLKETEEIKKQLRRNIEYLDEFTLNILSEVDELENQLRNHIFVEHVNSDA